MKEQPKDDGPAIMSLRDWFAGQALVGILSRGMLKRSDAARHAYEQADAMIRARTKGAEQ